MVDEVTPPMTATAIGARNSEPTPVPTAVGIMPSTIAGLGEEDFAIDAAAMCAT